MPPTIYSQPQSQAVVVGDSVTLDISAWGSQPMSYQWLFNGTNLSGATTSCLAFTNVQLADAGTYAVFLSNSIATLLSSNAVLTVSPPPPCVPPPSGLASWWRGEGDASDAVGGRNGALSGGVSFPSGKVGQAFSLNGVDGEVDLGSWFNLQVFSVALWVKANPSQNSSADIMDNNHTDYRSWVVQYNNTGLQFFWYSGNFGKIYFSLTPNTWQYLVITLETNYVARVYLDGQLQGSIAGTGPLTYDGTQFLRLGRWGSGGRYFNGALDEVDVYNRALTAAEITALYTAGKSGKCVTPVGPAILSQPADQVALVGGTATFAVTASGTPPLSYQWTLNGTNLTRATNNPLVLTNVQFSQAGLYAVLVTNLYGSVLSSNASLTVTAVPPAIVTQPLSQTVPVGTNAAFSVVVTGTPPLSYQWTLNGTNLTRATNNPLVLTNVQFSQAGLYAVLVTNFYGSVLSSNATLTVVAGLDTFYVANSGNNTVEKITASGASVFANTNLSNPQGVVRDSGGNLYVANYGNNTIAKFTPDGVGSVFAGAGLSGPVGLAIDGADNLYVANQRNGTILKFTPGGVSSTFATGVSGATGLALDTSGNLYVTASPGNILKFTPAGVRSTFASGLSSPTFLVVDSAGNVYVATLGPNNIQKFTPAGVGTVFAGTNLSGPYGMVFDSAGNLYVANSGNNTIARFTPAGVGSVFASTGLSIPIGLAFAPGLTPAVPPAITLQPQSQVVPAGSYVSFTVAATGTAPLSYQWRFNETNLAGQTTSALALVNVQSNAAGNYSVLVTNLYGSALSSNAMLTVNPPPPCLPPPAGLVSWWRGEGDATDAVGGHNGTLVGGASYRAGKVGQAFALNGVDGEVDLGSWFNLHTFSVALWVNASASQSTSADIMDNNHTDYRSWVVQYNNSGLQFFWYSGNLGKLYFSLTPDTWQYLVITLDSNYVARVYLDGQLQGSIAGTGPLTYDGTQFVRLGRWGSGGRYFNGLLDEVDVYNRALSPAEVTALYNAGAGGKCVNHPPTAANLAAATQQNQPFSLPVEKLLLLASDPDGDPLTLSAVSSTSTNGAPISLVTDSIIYTPLTNFIGADCFTYTVNDGRGGTASAYVLVQVRSRDVGSGNMLPLQPIPGGFLVSFAGVPGRAYTLQRAAAVTGPWISLGTVPVDFSGIASYADTNAPPANAYYRTVYLQP